ncbi:MAG: nuclear transport factor 2 family protein [Acidobacteria bacterium]|nr:nuclear transport factor 2 family protein [Acidobacteriota bacterium]
MKIKLLLLIMTILTASLFAAAQNAKTNDPKTEQALIDNEKTVWKNLVDKKYDDFGKALADDFQAVYPWGVFNKAAEMDSVRQLSFKSAEVTDVKVRMIDAGSAIVTAIVKSEFVFPDGKSLAQSVRTTSIVVKRGQGWLCIYHAHIPIATN